MGLRVMFTEVSRILLCDQRLRPRDPREERDDSKKPRAAWVLHPELEPQQGAGNPEPKTT